MNMNARRRPRGFTLVELLIVVAIVGILAAIAYPAYQSSVMKSRRADARAVLMEAAQFMERFYTVNFRYDAAVLPAALEESPKEGATKYYDIQLTANAADFTLSAVPLGAQSGDVCGTLTIDNTGAKGQATGKTVDECWR